MRQVPAKNYGRFKAPPTRPDRIVAVASRECKCGHDLSKHDGDCLWHDASGKYCKCQEFSPADKRA